MYHIYHTEAFVIGGTAHEEGSRRVYLFTRDLGLIHALAQGIREEKSKLRYSLQPYSHTHVSLVHGKTWRIVFAHTQSNFLHYFGHLSGQSLALVRILSLVRSLVVGEEKNAELFSILKNGFQFLKSNHTEREINALEHLMVLKMLKNLGYLPASPDFDVISVDAEFNDKMLDSVFSVQAKALRFINTALAESQLLPKKSPVL
ncbi:MAG: DNA repair protein RecO [Patescibacteria group bacterium]|nr:DNA repair protein RecO [bacterium]MDZ4241020.1 DNA repair protein RecO [Patescibacteria group bacterium]